MDNTPAHKSILEEAGDLLLDFEALIEFAYKDKMLTRQNIKSLKTKLQALVTLLDWKDYQLLNPYTTKR